MNFKIILVGIIALVLMVGVEDNEQVFMPSAVVFGFVFFYIIMKVLFSKGSIDDEGKRKIVERLPKYIHRSEIDIQELADDIGKDEDLVAKFLKRMGKKYKIGELRVLERGEFGEDELYFRINDGLPKKITKIRKDYL